MVGPCSKSYRDPEALEARKRTGPARARGPGNTRGAWGYGIEVGAVSLRSRLDFSQLDLVNSYWPLLIPKLLATDAFFVFLMVQFIRTLPRELDRAAWIDGAGPFLTFWYVVLPLMRPALVTTTIFTFIWRWNDFFVPLIYLTRTQVFTVPVALNSMVDSETQSGVGMLFAMSLLSLVPILIFFAVAQKYLIRGIATTGLK